MSLTRTAFKRPARPPSLARSRQWTGRDPSPRAPARAVPVAAMVVPLPKDKPWRCVKYREWVASHDCFACGVPGRSQAAHANFGKASRLKTDDSECFPLCTVSPLRVGCHEQHDPLIDMTLTERREREVVYVARMRALAKAAGWVLSGPAAPAPSVTRCTSGGA